MKPIMELLVWSSSDISHFPHRVHSSPRGSISPTWMIEDPFVCQSPTLCLALLQRGHRWWQWSWCTSSPRRPHKGRPGGRPPSSSRQPSSPRIPSSGQDRCQQARAGGWPSSRKEPDHLHQKPPPGMFCGWRIVLWKEFVWQTIRGKKANEYQILPTCGNMAAPEERARRMAAWWVQPILLSQVVVHCVPVLWAGQGRQCLCRATCCTLRARQGNTRQGCCRATRQKTRKLRHGCFLLFPSYSFPAARLSLLLICKTMNHSGKSLNSTFETMGHCPGVKCICSCTMATGALEVLLLVQLTNTGGSTGACCWLKNVVAKEKLSAGHFHSRMQRELSPRSPNMLIIEYHPPIRWR